MSESGIKDGSDMNCLLLEGGEEQIVEHIQSTVKIKAHYLPSGIQPNDHLEHHYYLLQYLYLQRPKNIIKCIKIINNLVDQSFTHQMEKGLSFNTHSKWYTDKIKINVTVEEKCRFIIDVTRALIHLSNRNIYQSDLTKYNIVKVGNFFKLIDFDSAYLVAPPKVGLTNINFRQSSEHEIIISDITRTSKKYLRHLFKSYFNGQKSPLHSRMQDRCIVTKEEEVYLKSNLPFEVKIQKMEELYKEEVNKFNAIQLGDLLQNIFNQQDLQEINKYRILKAKEKHVLSISILIDKLLAKSCRNRCTLQEFYSSFCFNILNKNIKQKSQKAESVENMPFFKTIMATQIEDYRQREFECHLKKDNTNMCELFWVKQFNQNFQNQIKDKMSKFYDRQNPQKMQNIKKEGLICLQMSDLVDLSIYDESICVQNADNMIEYYDKETFCQISKKLNFKQTMFVYQFLLLNYLKDQMIPSNYLISIQSIHIDFKKDDMKNKRIIVRTSSTKMQQNFINDVAPFCQLEQSVKIQRIRSQGFKNVIIFIKQICQGILHLEKYGLFHSQLHLDSIFHHNYFQIGNLHKIYVLDFIQNSSTEFLQLKKLMSIIFHFILGIMSNEYKNESEENLQKKNYEHFPDIWEKEFKALFEAMKQIDEHILKPQQIQIWKMHKIMAFMRYSYKKRHAIQFGSICRSLLAQYIQENIDNAKFMHTIKQNDQLDTLNSLINHLCSAKQCQRIDVSTFLAEFNKLYPFCSQKEHKQMLLYTNSKGELLCHRCIGQDWGRSQAIVCIQHSMPILFKAASQSNQFRIYFCNACIQNNNAAQISKKRVDLYDYQPYHYACLQINCKQFFISPNHCKHHHSNHQIIPLTSLHALSSNTFSNLPNHYQINEDSSSYGINLDSIEQIYNGKTKKIYQIAVNLVKNPDFYSRYFVNIDKTEFQYGFKEIDTYVLRYIKLVHEMERRKEGENDTKFMSLVYLFEYIEQVLKKKKNELITNVQACIETQLRKIESSIFNEEIYQKISQSMKEKYNEIEDQVGKCSTVQNLPKILSNLVEKLTATGAQLDFQTMMSEKELICSESKQWMNNKLKLYNDWIKDLQQTNSLSLSQRMKPFEDSIRQNIQQEILFIKGLLLSRKNVESELVNRQALQAKLQALQFEMSFNKQILPPLPTNQQSQHLDLTTPFCDSNSQFVSNLCSNQETIILSNYVFHTCMRNLPRLFHHNYIHQINTFTQLKELTFCISHKPYLKVMIQSIRQSLFFFQPQLFQNICSSSQKLEKIRFVGGKIQLFSFLEIVRIYCNRKNFSIWIETENVISSSEQIERLSSYFNLQFTISCVGIHLRKNIAEKDKTLILNMLNKMKQLRLSIEGNMINCRSKAQILMFLTSPTAPTITALTLKRVNLTLNHQILLKLLHKSRVQTIQMSKPCVMIVLCYNFPEKIFFERQSRFCKKIHMRNHLSEVLPQQFINDIVVNFIELESLIIDTTLLSESSNISLHRLIHLRQLVLRFCPWVTDHIINTLPAQSLATIHSLDLGSSPKIDRGSIPILSKMVSLKYLNVSRINVPPEQFLKMQTKSLQILHLRNQPKLLNVHLELFSQKWPELTILNISNYQALRQKITLDAFEKGIFPKLRLLLISVNQFTLAEKMKLNRRSINIIEYN